MPAFIAPWRALGGVFRQGWASPHRTGPHYRTGGTSGAWASRPGFFKLTHYPSFRPKLKPASGRVSPKSFAVRS
jgi:hypothetical protein